MTKVLTLARLTNFYIFVVINRYHSSSKISKYLWFCKSLKSRFYAFCICPANAADKSGMHDYMCIKDSFGQQSNLVVALHNDQVTHSSGKKRSKFNLKHLAHT